MSFDTKTIDLSGGPVNLMADPDVAAHIAAEPAETGARVFAQNTSTRAKVFYAEQAGAPPRSSRGHCLLAGDGFVLRLWRDYPAGAWIWAASTGTVAVSPANV